MDIGFRTVEHPYMLLYGEHNEENPILITRDSGAATALQQCVDYMVAHVVNEQGIEAALSWFVDHYPDTHLTLAAERLGAEVTRYFKGIAGKYGAGVVFPQFMQPESKLRWVERDNKILLPNEVSDLDTDQLRECESVQEDKTTFKHMLIEQGVEKVRKSLHKQLKRLAQKEPIQNAAPGNWENTLQKNDNDKYIPNLFNAIQVLSNDPLWDGVIAYNKHSNRIERSRRAPIHNGDKGPWTNTDDINTAAWLSERYKLSVSSSLTAEAVQSVSERNAFHPVCDYLKSLTWDKQKRVQDWLIDYLGALPELSENCSQQDIEEYDRLKKYLRLAGTKFLVSAVARVMEPPCKADCVLILEGDQGAGKSSALRTLGGEWFSDTPFNLGDKDAYQSIEGKWIVELAELDSFNKAEATRAKAFFSSAVDTYRKSYARRAQDYPRQCVFAGSTNQHEYLRDTENRRYWPVNCARIDLDGLVRARDQLWAEALQMYRDGVKWWPLPDEIEYFTHEQQQRHIEDPWLETIVEWLDGKINRKDEVTMNDILYKCLDIPIGKTGERAERIRVGRILKTLGWERSRPVNKAGQRAYKYKRPGGLL